MTTFSHSFAHQYRAVLQALENKTFLATRDNAEKVMSVIEEITRKDLAPQLRALLQAGFPLDYPYLLHNQNYPYTLIVHAVKFGAFECIKTLEEYGFDFDKEPLYILEGGYRQSFLHHAVEYKKMDMAHFFIENKYSVLEKGRDGNTILHVAYQSEDMIDYFLTFAGAKKLIYEKNDYNITPFTLAVAFNHSPIVQKYLNLDNSYEHYQKLYDDYQLFLSDPKNQPLRSRYISFREELGAILEKSRLQQDVVSSHNSAKSSIFKI